MEFLRIHGDNIIECTRALRLICNAFSISPTIIESSIFSPIYLLKNGEQTLYSIQLLPGHARWGFDIQSLLKKHGAPLRESTDILLTRLYPSSGDEVIIFAAEFCSALPAGNNAWQRNGRALACSSVGIPYLFYAEIGGAELDNERSVKAPRYPNPIIPFSYLTLDNINNVTCLPVYGPSPSISSSVMQTFKEVYGSDAGKRLIACLINGSRLVEPENELTQRAIRLSEILSANRKSKDTLIGKQWADFLALNDPEKKAHFLKLLNRKWSKKSSDKVNTTDTFKKLASLFSNYGAISIGGGDIPICLVHKSDKTKIGNRIESLYNNTLPKEFVDWFKDTNKSLIVVWVTGFKPRGDDSRPDRGLVPLARMLFGNDIEILTIVSGPAYKSTWDLFRRDPLKLAIDNGLWEAIIELSNAVLIDSATSSSNPLIYLSEKPLKHFKNIPRFTTNVTPDKFTENDVDTSLHLLFSGKNGLNSFEAMCNPPGGDWSGFTVVSDNRFYRWTSLPRVSGENTKRPDHAVLVSPGNSKIMLLIESKEKGVSVEEDIGPRMISYIEALTSVSPTIIKTRTTGWELYKGQNISFYDKVFTVAAFCWKDEKELTQILKEGNVDAVIGFEFNSAEQTSLLHLLCSKNGTIVEGIFRKCVENSILRVKIKVH